MGLPIGCTWVWEGALGGILIIWDRRVVEKVEKAVGNFPVSC